MFLKSPFDNFSNNLFSAENETFQAAVTPLPNVTKLRTTWNYGSLNIYKAGTTEDAPYGSWWKASTGMIIAEYGKSIDIVLETNEGTTVSGWSSTSTSGDAQPRPTFTINSNNSKTWTMCHKSSNPPAGCGNTKFYLTITSVDYVQPVTPVMGCMDVNANNYNNLATQDDASCSCYGTDCNGCTDNTALNYNSVATVDDGSCVDKVYGCNDNAALNYDATANVDDGNCEYPYDCPSASNYDSYSPLPSMKNVYQANKNWMNPDGTGFFDVNGVKTDSFNLHANSMTGDTISVSSVFSSSGNPPITLRLQPCAGISITIEDSTGVQSVITSPSTYTSSPIVAGSYGGLNTLTFKLISITGPTTVNGCTDSTATNYNNLATQDDSTCLYSCDTPNSNTNTDGSCATGCITGYEENNGDCVLIESSDNGNGDGNGNGNINTQSKKSKVVAQEESETNWMPFVIGGIALLGGVIVISQNK